MGEKKRIESASESIRRLFGLPSATRREMMNQKASETMSETAVDDMKRRYFGLLKSIIDDRQSGRLSDEDISKDSRMKDVKALAEKLSSENYRWDPAEDYRNEIATRDRVAAGKLKVTYLDGKQAQYVRTKGDGEITTIVEALAAGKTSVATESMKTYGIKEVTDNDVKKALKHHLKLSPTNPAAAKMYRDIEKHFGVSLTEEEKYMATRGTQTAPKLVEEILAPVVAPSEIPPVEEAAPPVEAVPGQPPAKSASPKVSKEPSHHKKEPPKGKINLYEADETALQAVPGIGPSTAGKILLILKEKGVVTKADLVGIRGISESGADKILEYLEIEKP